MYSTRLALSFQRTRFKGHKRLVWGTKLLAQLGGPSLTLAKYGLDLIVPTRVGTVLSVLYLKNWEMTQFFGSDLLFPPFENIRSTSHILYLHIFGTSQTFFIGQATNHVRIYT